MTRWMPKTEMVIWGKKILFIIFATLLTGGLVYAGLCSMWWNMNVHNKWNKEISCIFWESGQKNCIKKWGNEWYNPTMKGQRRMQNMSDEDKKEMFHSMMERKWQHFDKLTQEMDEIIDLADKVGYDTTKLKWYKIQLEEFRKEYKKFSGTMEENMKRMCNNKQKWRWANHNMRELMKKISVEFDNIKAMAQ